MDLNEIRKLVRLMDRAELVELEIEDQKAGVRVHLKRGDKKEEAQPQVVQYLASPQAAPAAPVAPVTVAPATGAPAPESPGLPAGVEPLKSPMVGTFYRSSSPDAEPFVGPGSKVDVDTVLCIIEAMKVMNEIKAETRGEIVEVLVENGEPVEFGQPLFLVKRG